MSRMKHLRRLKDKNRNQSFPSPPILQADKETQEDRVLWRKCLAEQYLDLRSLKENVVLAPLYLSLSSKIMFHKKKKFQMNPISQYICVSVLTKIHRDTDVEVDL